MKHARRLGVVALATLLLVACGGASTGAATPTPGAPDVPAFISASGRLVPDRWASLSFPVGGRAVDVRVQDGDVVAAGDVLAQIDDADARLAAAQAEAAVALAQAQLAQIRAGAQPEQIAAAEKSVDAAEAAVMGASAQLARLRAGAQPADIAAAEAAVAAAAAQQKSAQDAYDRIKEVGGTLEEQARGALDTANKNLRAAQERLAQLAAGPAQHELDSARASLAAAQAQRDVAQAQVDLLTAGPTPEQVAVAAAGVQQAQAALDAARAQLDKYRLVAPFDGTIGAVMIRPGETISPGQAVLTLGDLDNLRIETTDLGEVDIARVHEGQRVRITFDALPGATFTGQVTHIAPMSTPGQGSVNYPVIISLDRIDPAVRWGMTAFVDLELDQ